MRRTGCSKFGDLLHARMSNMVIEPELADASTFAEAFDEAMARIQDARRAFVRIAGSEKKVY